MKKQNRYAVAATLVALLIFASCGPEDSAAGNKNENEQTELHLQAVMKQPVQTDDAEDQFATIAKGEKVHVWADIAASTDTTPHFEAWELTADGTGGFGTTGKQYFPSGGQALNLYALHGDFTSTEFTAGSTPFPPTTLRHRVGKDQTAAGGYHRSDLIYAVKENVTPSGQAVKLTFYHLLAKVEVALTPGKGMEASDLSGAEVSLLNMKPDALFTPAKLTGEELKDRTKRAAMVAVADQENEPQAINLPASQNGMYSAAVIAPQAVEGGDFIEVRLAGGGEPRRHAIDKSAFESGKVYRYDMKVNSDASESTPLEVTCRVTDWNAVDGIDVMPHWNGEITVDPEAGLPPGVTLNAALDEVICPHTPDTFTIALACDQELELLPNSSDPMINVKAAPEKGKNRFLITRKALPFGYPDHHVPMQFRRKGLEESYPEDRITVTLKANSATLTGVLRFDMLTATCDFGKWVDGELGVLTLPAGREARLSFPEGTDPWMKLDYPENTPGICRILGGWRPNDPEADGREQTDTLIICDTGGKNEEKYIIKRRNLGLPVTKVNGVWWCKYNAIGYSTSFEDQISIRDDGYGNRDVFDYLKTCSLDEYMKLWNYSSYQGGSGKAMNIYVQSDANDRCIFRVDINEYTYNQDIPLIPNLPATRLAPDGYRLPSDDDWDKIFTPGMRTDRNGTYEVSQGEYTQVKVRSANREDLVMYEYGIQLPEWTYSLPAQYHFEVYNQEKGEAVTFYGPGDQWDNTNGIQHNKNLFAGEKTGRFVNGFSMTKKAGSRNDTYTLRFIKTPVEYIY